MRLGATKISFEKLHEVLNLDADVHIDDLFLNEQDRYERTIHVVLSGLSDIIPEHQEGSQLATNPLYYFQSIQPIYSPNFYAGENRFMDRIGFYQGLRRYI